MKVTIKVGTLLTALDRVGQSVDRNGTAGSASLFMAAYKSNTAQAVYFYSTNLTVEVNDKATCIVDVPGKSLIDPDQLLAGLANRDAEADATIELVTTGAGKTEVTRLRVSIGKNQFFLGYAPNDTEEMAKLMAAIPHKQAPAYTMSGKELAEFVRRASHCTRRDNEGVNRFELSGMKISTTPTGCEAYATDGHICARIRIKSESPVSQTGSVLVPRSALPALSKLVRREETVQIIEGSKNDNGQPTKLFYKLGAGTFVGVRLLGGQFPDLEVPLKAHAPSYWLTVDREALKHALERAVAFDKEERQVSLEISSTRLVIRAMNQGHVALEEELPVENISLPEELTVSRTINVDYLKNIASSGSQASMRLGVSNYTQKAHAGKALMVEDLTDQVECLYAIMPVVTAAPAKATA